MTATDITLIGVCKSFGTAVAVADLTAHLAAGSLTVLLGPSGCGKSTTLAMISGLLHPDAGQILFGGRSVLGVAAQRRPAGLVFQRPLLFPHLNVEQNVAFGLRMRGTDRRQTRQLVADMLERVQLSDLSRRRVGELSGGQEQRVALARALVLQPQVLLLDEPFSQLDAVLRAEMRALVKDLHAQSEVSTVFVTHDQAEAVQVADSIALMLSGHLVGHGEPHIFYTAPPSLAAARFFAVTNEFAGHIRGGTFLAERAGIARSTSLPDGPAVLVIRPETITLTASQEPSGSPGPARAVMQILSGVAVAARFAGTHLAVQVALPSGMQVDVHAAVGTAVQLGAPVSIGLPQDAGTVLAAEPDPPR